VFIYHLSHTCLPRLIARHLIPLIIFGLLPPRSVIQAIKVSSNFTFLIPCSLRQWSAAWGTRRHLTSIKTKHRNCSKLEPALILALTNICSRTEVLACHKQAQ
jgi:hypothetical protein